jgi:hypothetical protein
MRKLDSIMKEISGVRTDDKRLDPMNDTFSKGSFVAKLVPFLFQFSRGNPDGVFMP